MLAKEYTNYINAIANVAGAQIQTNGKFKSNKVLKNSHVAKAAGASYAFTKANASIHQDETAKYMNAEIAKMTFSAIKKIHKQLKKQGLALIFPGAAVGTTVVAADATQAKPLMMRREFISGVSVVAILAGVSLTPNQAHAGDKAYWAKVKKQIKAHLKSKSTKAMIAKSITG